MYPNPWMHQPLYPHPFLFHPFFFFGPWGLIVLLFWVLLVGIPVGRVLGRMGFSPWLAMLAFIPVVNLIFLWIVATTTWPSERGSDG